MKQWLLPGILILFALLSVLTLSSIAPSLAPRQLVFFLLGFFSFTVLATIPFKRLQELSDPVYVGMVLLLILTLAIGTVTKGSTRWIDVGGLFAIQPSQLAIPTTALYLLTVFKEDSLLKLKNLLNFLAIIAAPASMIFIEPDLGTTIVFMLSISAILLFSKTNKTHLSMLAILGIITVIFSWLFLLAPYQKARITSFVSTQDTQGAGYNARQSLIAVGSGQLSGRGLGQGIQSHLRFLPERQTDFVFASFAEEFGFIGSILVVSLYAALIILTIQTGDATSDWAQKVFCYVTAVMIMIQTGVNIGMNVGLLPITGITLPFFSYGGSSVITLLATYGVVYNIQMQQKKKVTLHLS